jgi:methionyl-tRNA formyltransferase
MGTPEFAVPSLQKLYEAGYDIAAVVTAPDRPAGRGMQLTQSAVKKYAVEKNLKILQPEKLKSPEFIEELQSLKADVQAVVAFRMLPEIVWNMPPMGTINLHGSLLPQYRGAAPINWAIING